MLTPIDVAVEQEINTWISEELTEETWLSEMNIQKAIEETIMESNTIVETMQAAIEEHQAGLEDAIIKEASVPFLSCVQGGARARAGVTDAAVQVMANDDSFTAGGAQSSAAFMITVQAGSGLEATTEAIPVDLVAGEEAIGLHGIPPARATDTAAGLTMAQLEHVSTARVQQADPDWLVELYCKLDEGGRERQGTTLPTSPTHESLGHSQGSRTSGRQALHAARQCMQSSHTDAEIGQVVRTLAVALGARRPEAGTIKALRAVVMLLERPEMSDEEAYTFTGASISNFKRWRKQVQSAQLGVSLV